MAIEKATTYQPVAYRVAPQGRVKPTTAAAAPVGLSKDSLAIRSAKGLQSTTPLSHIGKAVASTAAAPVRAGNLVEAFIDGKEAFPALHKLIDSAKHRIDMEYYAFFDDVAGNKVADKLIAKAKSGVEVNLLVNYANNFHASDLTARLREGGVRVRTFTNGHSVALLHPNSTVDHRKMTLVDGKVAMTGGMNIGDAYEKFWHDGMVKVEGPSVQDFYKAFEKNWALSHGEALRPTKIDTSVKGVLNAQLAVTATGSHEIKKGILAAFDHAKKQISVTSPYFIDEEIVASLERAAKRGVKVRAILPTKSDNPIVDVMHDTMTNRLMDAGVKVHHYDTRNYAMTERNINTERFNHIKAASVDGVWSTFGTANMDARSMTMSQENMLHIDSAEFTKMLDERLFEKDLATLARAAEKVEVKGAKRVLAAALEKVRFFF